ncbi:MAG TPA: hypothetical protein VIU62_06550 [Chloroflexota bacterium]|jgi:hypothetical protein
MLWRLLVFRATNNRRVLAGFFSFVAVALLAAAVITIASTHRRYQLTVNIQPPFVGEGVQVYAGCCHIVAQQAGDRRSFVFVLQRGDYNVGGLLAQNGEFRPLPTSLVPVHLDKNSTVTLHGSG